MSVTAARGFRAAGVAAGLKGDDERDVALVVNDGPRDAAAAVFTTNRCKANPVLWSERTAADGRLRAVVLNSGGANCYTGPDGFAATHATAETVAEVTGVSALDVLVGSTGAVGPRLDGPALAAGVRAAAQRLSTDGDDAAQAILTTDTVTKQARHVSAAGWVVGAMGKGNGMLAPGLATMLVVITTDADVEAGACDAALRAATEASFDRLDVDGCRSTNDTVVLMASGASGLVPDQAEFAAAVRGVCLDLMRQMQADAIGATHEIAVEVVGAATEADALEVARSVARSTLFKLSVYGHDPGWGRVLAAVGTTSAGFDPADIDVAVQGVWVCRGSAPGEPGDGVSYAGRPVDVTVDLKSGDARATVWTTDLTPAFVLAGSGRAA